MAVTANVLNTTARLTFEIGLDSEGKPILKNRSYNNVRAGAADQDIYDACQIISGLQQNTLRSVRKIMETELVNAV